MQNPSPAPCLIFSINELETRLLEDLVSPIASLRHLASLSDLAAARAFLQSSSEVDVLVVGVEQPDLAGLHLVRELAQEQPQLEVIIVASSPDFAAEAFNLHVADYLVKPVSPARFREAIELVARRRGAAPRRNQAELLPLPADEGSPAPVSPEAADGLALPHDGHDLFLKVNNRLVRIDFDDVIYLEAMSTYSVVVMRQHKHIVHLTLKYIAERMPFAHFQRVHRSYMVNTRLIDCVEDRQLIMAGHQIPLAKSYQSALLKSLRTL